MLPANPRRSVRVSFNSYKGESTSNAQRNAAVVKKMSEAERECGLTADQLTDLQRELKQSFYDRMAA